jgi:hypothetical protein
MILALVFPRGRFFHCPWHVCFVLSFLFECMDGSMVWFDVHFFNRDVFGYLSAAPRCRDVAGAALTRRSFGVVLWRLCWRVEPDATVRFDVSWRIDFDGELVVESADVDDTVTQMYRFP